MDRFKGFKLSAALLTLALLAACSTAPVTVVESEPESPLPAAPTTPPATAPVTRPDPIIITKPCPHTLEDMLIVGEVEHVLVGREPIMLQARVDTGAKTTSLNVSEVQIYERDGERWVQFNVNDVASNTPRTLQRPFIRKVRIKRQGESPESRPVVNLRIGIGALSRDIEVNLTDRSDFQYPVLIGRNFLDGHAVVDVSRKFVATDSE